MANTKKNTKSKASNSARKTLLKANKPAAKNCATAPKKPTQTAPKRANAPANRKLDLTGANEVSLTPHKIVVKRTMTSNTDGRRVTREVTEYHDKTPANMRAFNEHNQKASVKKMTVKY